MWSQRRLKNNEQNQPVMDYETGAFVVWVTITTEAILKLQFCIIVTLNMIIGVINKKTVLSL